MAKMCFQNVLTWQVTLLKWENALNILIDHQYHDVSQKGSEFPVE